MQKIHPIGFSGRREATTAPTVTNIRVKKGKRKSMIESYEVLVEALKKPRTPLSATNGRESAQTDHASHAAVRAPIRPLPRPRVSRACRVMAAPFWGPPVSRSLRRRLRGGSFREISRRSSCRWLLASGSQ